MKFVKKLTALFLAVCMVMAMGITASAKTVSLDDHTFSAYQIFTGTKAEGSNEMGSIKWGASFSSDGGAALVTALKQDTSIGSYFTNLTADSDGKYDATAVAEILAKATDFASSTTMKVSGDAAKNTQTFAEIVYDQVKSSTAFKSNITGTSVDLGVGNVGYYLFVDTNVTTADYEAYNLITVAATDHLGKATINNKTEVPEVDKLVQDENGDKDTNSKDSDGWGKTADHAINESFQFKLVASLPASIDYDKYDSYQVKFTDTMSAGVTFEEIVSVTVDGVTISAKEGNTAGYEVTGVSKDEAGKTWYLNIADVKAFENVDLSDGGDVVVIYKAHLNESAVVNSQSGTTTNKNAVKLEYSNNPNGEGTGHTPEKDVYVFTYGLNYVKYYTEDGQKKYFTGTGEQVVGFKLYSDAACTQEIGVYKDTKGVYHLIANAENKTAEEIFPSAADGTFKIEGLDTGTYYLHETSVPDGFNAAADTTIVITASHKIAESGPYTTLDGSQNMSANIENNKGTVLPSTGGMGTTVIYMAGIAMIVAAGVVVIARKKMA